MTSSLENWPYSSINFYEIAAHNRKKERPKKTTDSLCIQYTLRFKSDRKSMCTHKRNHFFCLGTAIGVATTKPKQSLAHPLIALHYAV